MVLGCGWYSEIGGGEKGLGVWIMKIGIGEDFGDKEKGVWVKDGLGEGGGLVRRVWGVGMGECVEGNEEGYDVYCEIWVLRGIGGGGVLGVVKEGERGIIGRVSGGGCVIGVGG